MKGQTVLWIVDGLRRTADSAGNYSNYNLVADSCGLSGNARVSADIALSILVSECTFFLPGAAARGLVDTVGRGTLFRDGVLALSAASHPVHLCICAAGLGWAFLALIPPKKFEDR